MTNNSGFRVQFVTRIDPDMLKLIDSTARNLGLSRNEFVSHCLSTNLHAILNDKKIDTDYLENFLMERCRKFIKDELAGFRYQIKNVIRD